MDWITVIQEWLLNSGYVGLFMFGILNFVIPSELILPFAGYMVYQEKLDFVLVILSALAGNIIKSSVIFWLGKRFGKDFLIKYSKFTHVDQSSIKFAKSRFEHYGYWIIIPGQFIPYFRRFISAPAGLLKLNFATFLIYNSIGVTLWFGFLTGLGLIAAENWNSVKNTVAPIMGEVGLVTSILALILIVYEIMRRFKLVSKTKNTNN